MRKFMFEPSNAKAGDFEVDKDIAPRVIYSLNFAIKRESEVVAEHCRVADWIETSGIMCFG